MNCRRLNVFLGLLLIFFVLFVNISPALADIMDDDNVNTRKERQLLKKIDIIHNTFKNQTDKEALYATLVHRGNYTDYVNQSYDPNWDEDEFRNQWSNFGTDASKLMDSPWSSGLIDIKVLFNMIAAAAVCLSEGNLDSKCVFDKAVESQIDDPQHNVENGAATKSFGMQSIDLLTAATIVMLDSSGWIGNYSDENYQKALAGVGLVGNLAEDNLTKFAASVFNGLFCTAGALADFASGGLAVDMATTGFNPTASFTQFAEFGSSALFSSLDQKLGRYYTMARICEDGFIGGTYQSVQYIDDDDIYQKRKNKIAKEIITLAQQMRTTDNSGDPCLTGSTQAGDLASIGAKECGEKFGAMAQTEYSRTGIFASITLAQAWLESNCGKYTPPNSNNLFGIKCGGSWTGECSMAGTSEFGSGGYYNITDAFRVYASVEESIADHSNFFIENERYTRFGVFEATTYAEQAQAISAAGYATDPAYASKLIGIIQANGYDKWDVKGNSTSSVDICAPVGLGGWNIRTVAPTQSDSAFADPSSSTNIGGNVGQCVWYAQGRSIEIVNELETSGKLSSEEAQNIRNLLYPAYGNGGDIYDQVKAAGAFNTSDNIKEPKAGSYIVWKQPGGYGHVAVIEEVNTTDNTITVTEGWASSGNSCPSDWSCVQFQNKTMDLDEFYNGYGQSYTGGYQFSGYVYFLEPLQ